MKTIGLILLFAQLVSAKTFEFDCVQQEAVHLNRFTLSGSVETVPGENGLHSFSDARFSVATTLRGNGNSTETKVIDKVSGTVEVFEDSSITQKPYMFLKVIDQARNLKMRLAIDFPRGLNSSIFVDGYLYKSNCTTRK